MLRHRRSRRRRCRVGGAPRPPRLLRHPCVPALCPARRVPPPRGPRAFRRSVRRLHHCPADCTRGHSRVRHGHLGPVRRGVCRGHRAARWRQQAPLRRLATAGGSRGPCLGGALHHPGQGQGGAGRCAGSGAGIGTAGGGWLQPGGRRRLRVQGGLLRIRRRNLRRDPRRRCGGRDTRGGHPRPPVSECAAEARGGDLLGC
mmetsp:Transcript_1393/g.3123  ORF Transcript_1393/g.3123 Transcript_1393/m.3123 type:complete len:201 (+) Transcript_1393:2054-2656(+)